MGACAWGGSRLATAMLMAALGCAPGRTQVTAQATAAPSSTVYRDPRTRRFVAPPAGTSLPLAPARASLAPLVEVACARGGWMVRVGDRFQHQMQAQIGGDGRVSTTCAPGRP